MRLRTDSGPGKEVALRAQGFLKGTGEEGSALSSYDPVPPSRNRGDLSKTASPESLRLCVCAWTEPGERGCPQPAGHFQGRPLRDCP